MMDAQIIEELGGPAKLAKLLGLQMKAVSAWKKRGITWSKRAAVAQLARKKRLTLPMDFLTTRR